MVFKLPSTFWGQGWKNNGNTSIIGSHNCLPILFCVLHSPPNSHANWPDIFSHLSVYSVLAFFPLSKIPICSINWALNSQPQSSCLHFLSSGITGVWHHVQIPFIQPFPIYWFFDGKYGIRSGWRKKSVSISQVSWSPRDTVSTYKTNKMSDAVWEIGDKNLKTVIQNLKSPKVFFRGKVTGKF